MKLTDIIFVIYTLSVMVKGAFWAAAVQPLILSIGAILSAIDLDVLDVQPIKLKNVLKIDSKIKSYDQDDEDRLQKELDALDKKEVEKERAENRRLRDTPVSLEEWERLMSNTDVRINGKLPEWELPGFEEKMKKRKEIER